MSKINPDKINLVGIYTTKSAFWTDTLSQVKYELPATFDLGFKTNYSHNTESRFVMLRLFIKIKGLNAENKILPANAEFIFEFGFEVDNLTDFVSENDEGEGEILSSELGGTIAAIAYSTSRGLIFNRLNDTPFGGFLLPVINPNRLINEDSYTDMD